MEYIYVPSTILSPSQTLSYFSLITVLEGRCFLLLKIRLKEGFPCGSAGKESACNAGDLGWEDPLKKGRLPTPVFWPGELDCTVQNGLYSPWSHKKSDTTERLSGSKKGSDLPKDI